MTSIKKARDEGKLDQFAKEHEAVAPGDGDAFNRALRSMAGKLNEDPEASKPDRSDG